jgi:hypothetical protein
MRNLFAISFLVLALGSFAQVDKKWVVGYSPSILQFDNGTTSNYVIDSNLIVYTINTLANICDEQGNLLFFTNGMCLFDRFGDTIENAFGFHPPLLAAFYGVVASSSQAALILPKDMGLYYYFYYSMSDSNFAHNKPFDLLYYSVVDMNMNGGRGKVISKNNLLLSDTLIDAYGLTACRHANGRDWWLIKIKYLENGYFKYLVTPGGIIGPEYQLVQNGNFGTPTAFGQCVFSNNGDLVAATNEKGGVKVMHFDRCTGEITRWLDLTTPLDPITQYGIGGSALSFSPSGRFLYVNTFKEVHQFDLMDTHVQQSIIRVGMEDTLHSTMFEQSQIGPDGKIYIGNFNGSTNSLSVVNNPEEKGLQCNFTYHSDTIKGSLAVNGIPNMPNYHLGALIGSACDTITAINEVNTTYTNAYFFPNPASDYAKLFLNFATQETGELQLYDLRGRVVLNYSIIPDKAVQEINLKSVNSGTYLYSFQTANGFHNTGRLVVLK